MGIDSEKLFFNHYVLADKYADNGEYSHTNLVRLSDGKTAIVDCFERGAKNTEQTKEEKKGDGND